MQEMKGKRSTAAAALVEETAAAPAAFGTVNKIVFACDAGMGSSAMGASILRNKVKKGRS
ncbi:hypothetical protein GCM10020331_085580 [Ectobacillus funiculus]